MVIYISCHSCSGLASVLDRPIDSWTQEDDDDLDKGDGYDNDDEYDGNQYDGNQSECEGRGGEDDGGGADGVDGDHGL